ncbi:MAG TPA: class II aldolase/adducin family protein [Roseiflexaceae bacterium]|nr:class II aldolase/adducin family protein [Roseiflexaceae bacterium]
MDTDPRPLMVEIARLLYDRFLTNSAGGNMSCRAGEQIFITPRFLGSRHRWRLNEDMVLVCDQDGTVIDGDPALISRESKMHFALFRAFPQVNGVIHAHPRELSVFAAAGRPLLPFTDYTEKYGVTEVVPYYPSHSQELADAVVAALRPRSAAFAKNGLGLILAWHGVVVAGRDLADAYDTLERLEWAAHVQLMSHLLADEPPYYRREER